MEEKDSIIVPKRIPVYSSIRREPLVGEIRHPSELRPKQVVTTAFAGRPNEEAQRGELIEIMSEPFKDEESGEMMIEARPYHSGPNTQPSKFRLFDMGIVPRTKEGNETWDNTNCLLRVEPLTLPEK